MGLQDFLAYCLPRVLCRPLDHALDPEGGHVHVGHGGVAGCGGGVAKNLAGLITVTVLNNLKERGSSLLFDEKVISRFPSHMSFGQKHKSN